MSNPDPIKLEIIRPDDWHLHLRSGDMMRAVLPHSAEIIGRAVIMPSLTPPILTISDALAYRNSIVQALPEGHPFEPLYDDLPHPGNQPQRN